MAENSDGRYIFSRADSAWVKGLGVLLFCLHHLYWKRVMAPVEISVENADQLLVAWTKMALSLFTILSGYGLTKSYEKYSAGPFQFVKKHIVKLLVSFWWVYVPVFILSFFFHIWGTPVEIYGGINAVGIRNFLLEIFGMRALLYTPTLNQSWWYFEAIIFLYILFPFFYRVIDSHPIALLTVAALPPAIVGFGLYWNETFQTEREVFWMLPFVAGMLLARHDTLDRIKESQAKHGWVWVPVIGCALLVCMYFRSRMLILPDTIYAIVVIMGCIWAGLYFPGFITAFITTLGKYSMTIFMIHSFLYYYFDVSAKLLKRVPDSYGIRYVVFVLYSLIVAMAFEKLKAGIVGFFKGKKNA